MLEGIQQSKQKLFPRCMLQFFFFLLHLYTFKLSILHLYYFYNKKYYFLILTYCSSHALYTHQVMQPHITLTLRSQLNFCTFLFNNLMLCRCRNELYSSLKIYNHQKVSNIYITTQTIFLFPLNLGQFLFPCHKMIYSAKYFYLNPRNRCLSKYTMNTIWK